MILCKGHIDKQISNVNQHNTEDCEGQSFSVIMEVLCNVHVIQSDNGIEILFFDLHMSEFSYFHQKLCFLGLSKSLVDKHILNTFQFLLMNFEKPAFHLYFSWCLGHFFRILLFFWLDNICIFRLPLLVVLSLFILLIVF